MVEELILVEIRLAARDINLYTFERFDGGLLMGAEPGAHIGLCLPNGIERQYSLINPCAKPIGYTVGIKRDTASRGGSSFIHDELKVGMALPITHPRNNFALDDSSSHVTLIAGGIGITPMYAMLQSLKTSERAWKLHYCCRSRADAAFLRELETLPEVELYFDDEHPGQLPPVAEMVGRSPANGHLYCCGPAPMLKAFEAANAHRPPETIHVEYFTQKYEADTKGGYVVQLQRSGLEFTIPPGQTILHILRDAGIEVPSSCEEGVCGACETKVISGKPDHRDAILSAKERAENATMMICCSGSKSDRLVLDI